MLESMPSVALRRNIWCLVLGCGHPNGDRARPQECRSFVRISIEFLWYFPTPGRPVVISRSEDEHLATGAAYRLYRVPLLYDLVRMCTFEQTGGSCSGRLWGVFGIRKTSMRFAEPEP